MNAPPHQVLQRFAVEYEYPVVFTRHIFAPGQPALADILRRAPAPPDAPARAAVFVDRGVAEAFPELAETIRDWFAARAPEIILAATPEILPGGEALKNDPARVWRLAERLAEYRLCRHSYVLAVGGGALLDAVGFAAALVHRGLRLIRIPTTVVAQCDSGVGVKNAVNGPGGKNLFGVFAPPFAVLNDFAWLDRLSDADWRGGAAEAFKVAMIRDALFFDFLEKNADAVRRRDAAAMEELIIRCAELHLEHIRAGDPFEFGQARPLDYGHWAAHELELLSDHRISHGAAVAAGIALDAAYAARQGWLAEADAARLRAALTRCGLRLGYPEMRQTDSAGRPRILDGLRKFREHLGGRLCVTFPDSLGRRREEHTVDMELMTRCLNDAAAAAERAE